MKAITAPTLLRGFLVATLLLLTSCAHRVVLNPVEIKPIHITVDVNLKIASAQFDSRSAALPHATVP